MTCGKYGDSHFITKEGGCYSLWAVMTVKPAVWVTGFGPGIKTCYYSCWLAEFPGLTSLEFALLAKDQIFTDRASVWILLLLLWLTGSAVWGRLFNLSVLNFSIHKQENRPNSTQNWELSDSIVWQRLLCCTELLSHVQLFANPWTVALQAPLTVGIAQARILHWVAMPSCRGSSQPRDWTQVSCIAGRFFTSWATKEDQQRLLVLTKYPQQICSVGDQYNYGYKWILIILGDICLAKRQHFLSPLEIGVANEM